MDQTDAGPQPAQSAAFERGWIAIQQLHLPGAGRQTGTEQPQQTGLARAGRPDNGDPFAVIDAQVNIVQGLKTTGVGQAHPVKPYGHCNRPAERAASSIPW